MDSSEWTAPIVPIPKGDEHLCICGDYQVTVNPLLVVYQHPLPKPEELLSSFSGGQKFSKIDYHMPTNKWYWIKSHVST